MKRYYLSDAVTLQAVKAAQTQECTYLPSNLLSISANQNT